jgi:hypothetical protein
MGSRIQVQIDCRMIAVEKGENEPSSSFFER